MRLSRQLVKNVHTQAELLLKQISKITFESKWIKDLEVPYTDLNCLRIPRQPRQKISEKRKMENHLQIKKLLWNSSENKIMKSLMSYTLGCKKQKLKIEIYL
jgi:hypothetical protein